MICPNCHADARVIEQRTYGANVCRTIYCGSCGTVEVCTPMGGP